MNFRKMKGAIAETFELPKEILLDLPRVTVTGNQQLYIQNHRGIVEYTDKIIRISISGGELVVKGERLIIRNVFSEEILIEGVINSLNYGI